MRCKPPMLDIVFDGGPSIKWVGQTWRRR
uniref:Uncharacterized protein n=1 Tax=Arundo donax TaxID=35708 RepID=A0A0A8Y3J7_ARUDO